VGYTCCTARIGGSNGECSTAVALTISSARRGRTERGQAWRLSKGRWVGTFPRCRKCGAGDLVPSDGSRCLDQFKAWVCTNPNCLYNVKIRNGDIIINER
jgi:hypothetical protein